MELDKLGQIPVVGGCLVKTFTFAFGLPFLCLGIYLICWGNGEVRMAELGLGFLCIQTGLLVIVPYGLGYSTTGRPLFILWSGSLFLFLLVSLAAKVLGYV